MTLQAQYWIYEPGQPPVRKVAELTTGDEVRAFVATLATETVSDAVLTHTTRPRVDTAIPEDERGALSYRGDDEFGNEPVHLYSHGDGPEQPVLYETDEFPPYCEIPAETVAEALFELLETGSRPLNITWQSGDASVLS